MKTETGLIIGGVGCIILYWWLKEKIDNLFSWSIDLSGDLSDMSHTVESSQEGNGNVTLSKLFNKSAVQNDQNSLNQIQTNNSDQMTSSKPQSSTGISSTDFLSEASHSSNNNNYTDILNEISQDISGLIGDTDSHDAYDIDSVFRRWEQREGQSISTFMYNGAYFTFVFIYNGTIHLQDTYIANYEVYVASFQEGNSGMNSSNPVEAVIHVTDEDFSNCDELREWLTAYKRFFDLEKIIFVRLLDNEVDSLATALDFLFLIEDLSEGANETDRSAPELIVYDLKNKKIRADLSIIGEMSRELINSHFMLE